MAKKIKYYGVLAIKTMNVKHCEDLPEEIQKLIKGLTKKITVARVFVFDNELKQVECLANVEGCEHLISIEATCKAEFMDKVLSIKTQLKEEYIHEDVESDDEDPGETPSPC